MKRISVPGWAVSGPVTFNPIFGAAAGCAGGVTGGDAAGGAGEVVEGNRGGAMGGAVGVTGAGVTGGTAGAAAGAVPSPSRIAQFTCVAAVAMESRSGSALAAHSARISSIETQVAPLAPVVGMISTVDRP